jgi:hypothetical protein
MPRRRAVPATGGPPELGYERRLATGARMSSGYRDLTLGTPHFESSSGLSRTSPQNRGAVSVRAVNPEATLAQVRSTHPRMREDLRRNNGASPDRSAVEA